MAIGRRKIYTGYKKRKSKSLELDIFNYQEYWTPEKIKERKDVRNNRSK